MIEVAFVLIFVLVWTFIRKVLDCTGLLTSKVSILCRADVRISSNVCMKQLCSCLFAHVVAAGKDQTGESKEVVES